MYIPATFFSTQGSCVIATTTSITGSGTITTGSFISGGFYWDYYKFENTANLTSVSSSFSASLNILSGSTGQAKLLIVAGGGAGGYAAGVPCPTTFASTAAGGGGAGGVVYYNQFPISSGSYEIVVGAGGGNAGGRSGSNSYIKLTNDFVYTPFTSSFITANGGGLGGYVIRPDDCGSGLPKSVSSPTTGGSGGGAARPAGFAAQAGAISNANGLGGLNDANQGTNGGGVFNSIDGIQYDTQGAGGGGSATSGSPANFTPNSNTLTSVGGDGLIFNLTGTSLTYAAGGGGAAGTGFPYTLKTSANGSGTSGFGNGGHADVANFNAGTQATSGVVIIAIPRCTAAFDCKTFAISGSGGTIDYLACTSYGFVTQSTTIPLYDVLNACLTTLSGSNTPLILNGNYQSATLIGSCDTPQTSSIPSEWPVPYDTCSCLSYIFTAGGSGGTASNILYCGSTISSSISMSAGQQLVLCVNSSSANYFSLSGAGSSIAYNGQCSTGSCSPVSTSLYIDYLVVGGGGAGGAYYGGGGGAGAYVNGSTQIPTSQSFNIVVGAGGAQAGFTGNNGQASSAFGYTAIGGGYGGIGFFSSGFNGNSGSSGGGGAFFTSSAIGGTGLQGNNGGNGFYSGIDSGGGGGAATAGVIASSTSNGGNGLTWLDGLSYAGGGGGARRVTALESSNGLGNSGGGNGGQWNSGGTFFRLPTSGSANTGGGGGGAPDLNASPAGNWSGGSGVVKLRYFATASLATGGTITSGSGYIYHTFTGSGTLTTL